MEGGDRKNNSQSTEGFMGSSLPAGRQGFKQPLKVKKTDPSDPRILEPLFDERRS